MIPHDESTPLCHSDETANRSPADGGGGGGGGVDERQSLLSSSRSAKHQEKRRLRLSRAVVYELRLFNSTAVNAYLHLIDQNRSHYK